MAPALLLMLLAAPPGPSVQLVVSMGSQGISAHPTRMLAPDVLARLVPPALVETVGFHAFQHGHCLAVAGAGTSLAQLQAWVRTVAGGSAPSRRTVDVAWSPQDVTFDDGDGTTARQVVAEAAATPGEDRLVIRGAWLSRASTDRGTYFLLGLPGCEPSTLPADPLAWEVRSLTITARHFEGGQVVRAYSVARPLGEGVRRHRAHLDAASAARAAGVASFELLGGDDIEGASYLDQGANLHRPLTEAALQARRPAAWVPQSAELHAGLDEFVRTATRVGAEPVSANLVRAADGGRVLPGHVLLRSGASVLAVLGVTGPREADELPPQVARVLRVGPPRPALERALREAVAELGRWPDVVVVLGRLEGADAAAAMQMPGVDLAYVQAVRTYHAVDQEFRLHADGGRATRRPVFTPPVSVYRTEVTALSFHPGDGGVDGLRHVARALEPEERPDPAQVKAVQAIRQPIYVAGTRVLLPDPTALLEQEKGRSDGLAALADKGSGGRPRFGRRLYARLVSAAVQDATHAEVVITPPPREFWSAEGGFSELRLRAALAGQDTLVACLVSADDVQRALREADARGFGVAGAEGRRVGGRSVDARERYLLVTTEAVAVVLGLEGRVVAQGWRNVPGGYVPVPFGGRALPYRAVVMERLEALSRLAPTAQARATVDLLAPRAARVAPRLLLEARDVTLSFSAYDVRGEERYPAVPDNRVRTPDNAALLFTGTLRAVAETPGVVLEARLVPRWDRRVFNNKTSVEAANRWTGSLEARLPSAGFRLPSLGWKVEPFASQQVDSQFFALPAPRADAWDAWRGPTLALARTGAGVAILEGGMLREWRLGAILQEDLSQSRDIVERPWRPAWLTPGVESSGLAIYEAGPIDVELTHTWRFLSPRPGGLDTARDLSVTALTRVAAKARIMPGLALSWFSDAYVFMGRRLTDRPGMSYTLGMGLALDRTYKPLSELGYLW